MATDTDDSRRSRGSSLRAVPLAPDAVGNRRSDPGARARRYHAGEVIAEKYLLGRVLGQGGMGDVWLAHNQTLDIDVAIKLIRAESANADLADRLLTEARAAARLGHPAIVRINDFGKTSLGDPYIVMELLDGEDLAKTLVARGRLSPMKAVRSLLPIAHALTTAHTKGIVHRDLKPGNIFLAKTDEGHINPKLVDFGVAKLENEHPPRPSHTGALFGSPLYMSPEQARGDDVDHRADIWALAVVLYETMVGRPPFDGKNYNAVLYSITTNPPTPITDFALGDPELWAILDRALQKDPDRRWYSMRDFGEALARWLQDRGVFADITGASLETNWLSWNRHEDALSSSGVPSGSQEAFSARPAERALFVAGPVRRSNVTTVRRPRSRDRRNGRRYWAAFAVALLVAMAAGWMLLRDPKTAVPLAASRPEPLMTVSDMPRATSAPAVDPAHEQVVAAVLAEAAASGSAPGAPRGVRQPHAGTVTPAGTGTTATPGSMQGTPDRPLKNPFE